MPEGFLSSSLSVTDSGVANIRCVDYFITPEGYYRHFQGRVVTRNFRSLYSFRSRTFTDFEEVVPAKEPTHDSWCHGLEDIRIGNDLAFTATQLEWRYEGQPELANIMAIGRYPSLEFITVRPPEADGETWCEKNYLPFPGGVIYRWHPFEVATVVGDRLEVRSSYSTPAWWRHLRGSAPPFLVPGRTLTHVMALAHFVTGAAPRDYYSVLVELESVTLRPKAVSLPFVFFGAIEYCLSAQCVAGEVHFFVSHWDRESYVVVVPVAGLPELFPVS